VELFEQIRREYADGAGTIQGVANKLGIHHAWCAKHWPTQFPENERLTSDASRNWKQQWLSSRRFWKETERRHESSGTPLTQGDRSNAGVARRPCGVRTRPARDYLVPDCASYPYPPANEGDERCKSFPTKCPGKTQSLSIMNGMGLERVPNLTQCRHQDRATHGSCRSNRPNHKNQFLGAR
jgi:hypothetical protein